MSRTITHRYTKLRWESNRKRRSWSCGRGHRRAEYWYDVVDGIREFEDTHLYWNRPLDYVTRPYLHTWHALEDRRHWGRRPGDRRRGWVRPGAFDRFVRQMLLDDEPPVVTT